VPLLVAAVVVVVVLLLLPDTQTVSHHLVSNFMCECCSSVTQQAVNL
jgi:hypothetical protein